MKFSPELEVAMSFARLELLELEHGRRTLTQCPGIKAVALECVKAEAEAAAVQWDKHKITCGLLAGSSVKCDCGAS